MARASLRHGHARDIAECLTAAAGRGVRRRAFQQAQLETRWAEIVGPALARQCTPAALTGTGAGLALELATSSAIAPRLAMIEVELIERVNRFLGGPVVARIRLRHALPVPADGDPAPAAAGSGQARPAPPPPAELRAIADPGLRAALERLAAGIATTEGPPVFDGGGARR